MTTSSLEFQIDAIFDQLIMLDMVIHCFRPFVNEQSIVVYDLKKIRFEYFASDFVLDLIAAVPWDLIYTYT